MLIFQFRSIDTPENPFQNAQTDTAEEGSITEIEEIDITDDIEIDKCTSEKPDSKSRFEPLEGSFIDHPKIKDFGEYFCVFLIT